MRSPKAGDKCLAPSTTLIALSAGIVTRAARGAAGGLASLMSIRQDSTSLRFPLPTWTRTANRNRPNELHPFIQYAASNISILALSFLDLSEVTRLRTAWFSNNSSIACRSSRDYGQNLSPRGMLGLISRKRSRARCFQVLFIACRMTTRTHSGFSSPFPDGESKARS